MRVPKNDVLQRIYGETKKSRQRFENLGRKFERAFGCEQMEFFSAPGRAEIIGNHTDHNGGKVLAASIDLDTIGAAWPSGNGQIEIISEGYDAKIVVDVGETDTVSANKGTVSLVTGIVEAVKSYGFQISGFRAYITTEVLSSAGISSSASFEMILCSIIDFFFNEGMMGPVMYAKIGKRAENKYWNKSSGLMDQMACAVGGTILLDFSEDVSYQKIDFNFSDMGYQMIIVNTGKGHADLSREYSEIPQEMFQVAECLGVRRLCETSFQKMKEKAAEIVGKIGNDRAVLRAVHFFEENRRTAEMTEAIGQKNGKRITELITESGKSSWELLQNCYAISDYKEQKIGLYLTLTELFLQSVGDGCCRVHGGGFAGVILCIVSKQDADSYVDYISAYVGRENVYPMQIRQIGAVRLEGNMTGE